MKNCSPTRSLLASRWFGAGALPRPWPPLKPSTSRIGTTAATLGATATFQISARVWAPISLRRSAPPRQRRVRAMARRAAATAAAVATEAAVAAARVGNPPKKSPQSFLGHPGLAQSIGIGSAELGRDGRAHVSADVADSRPRTQFEIAADVRAGFFGATKVAAGGSFHSNHGRHPRLGMPDPVGPLYGLSPASGGKMRMGQSAVEHPGLRIERAKAPRSFQRLDRSLRLMTIALRPSEKTRRESIIGIKRQRPLHRAHAGSVLAGQH